MSLQLVLKRRDLKLFPKHVTITFVNVAVSGLTLIRQLPVPLLPLSFTPNSITVILSTINSLSLNYSVSSRSRTLLPVVVKAPESCHITPILRCFHWLRITECIEYKLLSLTYKVLTTTQPPYLHNLISIQRPRSTRSSSVVTFARPPSSSSLKITDRSSVMLHLVSGISSLCLFVNLILATVPPSPAHRFLHPSLIPLLIHHFVHL